MDNMAVFPVLIGEIAKRNIKKGHMAKTLGICDKALYNKLRGIVSFTWDEAQLIRNTYFPDMDYDVLYSRGK